MEPWRLIPDALPKRLSHSFPCRLVSLPHHLDRSNPGMVVVSFSIHNGLCPTWKIHLRPLGHWVTGRFFIITNSRTHDSNTGIPVNLIQRTFLYCGGSLAFGVHSRCSGASSATKAPISLSTNLSQEN